MPAKPLASRVHRLILAAALIFPASAVASTPGALDLIEDVQTTYASLPDYRDLGEIQRTERTDDGVQESLRFFETSMTPEGDLTWRVHGETPVGFEERVVWSRGGESFVFSSLHQQYKPIQSVPAEIVHGFGQGSYEALIVPLLLSGFTEGLSETDQATVTGPKECKSSTCWILSLTWMGGDLESAVWIDTSSHLIRRVVTRQWERRLPAPGSPVTSLERPESPNLLIEVAHTLEATEPEIFEPPLGARQVAEWNSTPDQTEETATDPWQDVTFGEEITVALFSVDARIVDWNGSPLEDLTPQDLVVKVGDQTVPVHSLDWTVGPSGAEAGLVARTPGGEFGNEPQAEISGAPQGRTVVLFVQADLEPSRIKGHLKLLPSLELLLETLRPEDRLAIVSFDSHLKLWLDFTEARDGVLEVLRRAISFSPAPSRPRKSPRLSLAQQFDFSAAKDAATPEQALFVTADALSRMPGEKELIYIGWGLGRYGAGGVRMTADYEPAVRALDAARATVFVLDISQADRHTLEVGLQNVANHTGGTYARLFRFTAQGVKRLARTISGRYTITLDRSHLPTSRGRLTIALRQKKGRVLFKPMIIG